jgi:ParB-like chromosome segregation protein Spo0J
MVKASMARQIEVWPISRLVPYSNNSRTHSQLQVQQIARSIQRFGFTNPILVDSQDGILAGHGRLAAARDLGLKEVPVIVLDHLNANERRAYLIADNQLALNAGWDTDVLQQEVAALNLADFDLDVLGFDVRELDSILNGEFGAEQEEEEEEDESFERGQPLAIILEPQEMRLWRQAKTALGVARDKAALLKLVEIYLGDEQ